MLPRLVERAGRMPTPAGTSTPSSRSRTWSPRPMREAATQSVAGVPGVARRRRARSRLLRLGALASRRCPGAHRARDRRPEFDTVLVAGAVEGNFPSLSRPEPMFDLAVLDRPDRSESERDRARLEDERRLFDVVLGRARRASCWPARTPTPMPTSSRRGPGSPTTTRLGDRRPPGRSRSRSPSARPRRPGAASSPTRRPPAWQPPRRPRRAASPSASTRRAGGSSATGPTPARPLHETIRVSYSRLSNLEACELMHVLGDELGLGHAGRLPRLGGQDGPPPHRGGREAARSAKDPRRHRRGAATSGGARRSSRRWPCPTAFRKLAREQMLRNWFDTYGEHAALGDRAALRVRVRGRHHRWATSTGSAPAVAGRHRHHRLQDRQGGQRRTARREPAAGHLLPRGAGVGRARRRSDRSARSSSRSCAATGGTARSNPLPCADQRARRGDLARPRMRERLADADRPEAGAERDRGLSPEPVRELPLLRLPDALPAVRGRAADLPGRTGAKRSARMSAHATTVPAEIVAALGGAAHRRAVGRDLDAARAVRARGGRRAAARPA